MFKNIIIVKRLCYSSFNKYIFYNRFIFKSAFLKIRMKSGHLTEGIKQDMARVEAIDRIYHDLREQGRDLYIIDCKMFALPDETRETEERGETTCVVMTDEDLRDFSSKYRLRKLEFVANEPFQKWESRRKRIAQEQEIIDRYLEDLSKQRLMKPLTFYERCNNFSVEGLRRAANGEIVCIHIHDIDTC